MANTRALYTHTARFSAAATKQGMILLRVQEETATDHPGFQRGTNIQRTRAHIAPGTQPEPGKRRFYLTIEGRTNLDIKGAEAETDGPHVSRVRGRLRRQSRPLGRRLTAPLPRAGPALPVVGRKGRG